MGKGQKIHRESKSRKTNSEKRRRNIEKTSERQSVGQTNVADQRNHHKQRTIHQHHHQSSIKSIKPPCSRSAEGPGTSDYALKQKPRGQTVSPPQTVANRKITTIKQPKTAKSQQTDRTNKQKNAADQRKAQGQAIMRCNKKPKAKPHHHCF